MATTQPEVRGFSSPFEVPVPDGCEGWESMYPYYALFSEERRQSEEARGWFRDGMHFPEPMFPFDFVTADSPYMCLGQANTRIFAVPPALGIDHRVLYGWVYMSANGVTDEAEIGRRAQLFGERAGFYFQNWDDLYGRWQAKVQDTIGEIAALEVPDLPEIEDSAVVTEGRGIGSAHTLLVAYNRLLESIDRIWQYHFEFLNLGYAAYLVFYELCKQSFPDIPDQTIAKMVSGIDVVLFRPDSELGRLAGARARTRHRGLDQAADTEDALRTALRSQRPGSGVAGRLGDGQEPVVLLLKRQRLLPPPSLLDRRSRRPLAHLRNLHRSASKPARTSAARSPRSAPSATGSAPSTGRCSATPKPPPRSIRTSVSRGSCSRTSKATTSTSSTGTTRSSGTRSGSSARCLQRNRFLDDTEDVFYLQRHELSDALVDLRLAWAAGSEGRGPGYWPPIVSERKRIMEAMRRVHAAAGARRRPGRDHRADDDHALGHHHRAGAGLGRRRPRRRRDDHRFRGVGRDGEGPARVILDPRAARRPSARARSSSPRSTSPSWTPVFGTIAAAVSDIGGIMSHAAIVSREYRLPAVVGTGNATSRIKTGDRLRVDGDAGTVTILS